MSLWRSAPWMQIEKPQHPYDTIAKEWANPIQKSTHNVTNSQAISYVLQVTRLDSTCNPLGKLSHNLTLIPSEIM